MNSPAEGIFIRKSSPGLFFFFFSLLSRRIDEGIEGRAHWHTEEIEDEAEGKIEEVKWKRLPWRGRERGEISILP